MFQILDRPSLKKLDFSYTNSGLLTSSNTYINIYANNNLNFTFITEENPTRIY